MLAARQVSDTRADELGDNRTVIEHERDHDGPIGGARQIQEANARQKKIIMISTGTARQNSMTIAQIPCTILLGSRRPMPNTRPNTTEPITARNAARSVAHRPGR